MVIHQKWFGFGGATAQRQLSSPYFASIKMIWSGSQKAHTVPFWHCSDQPPNTYEDSHCQETKNSSTLKKRTHHKSANKKQSHRSRSPT